MLFAWVRITNVWKHHENKTWCKLLGVFVSCHLSLSSWKTHKIDAFSCHSFKPIRITTKYPKGVEGIGSVPGNCFKLVDSSALLQLAWLCWPANLQNWICLIKTKSLIQAEIIYNCKTCKQMWFWKWKSKSDTCMF